MALGDDNFSRNTDNNGGSSNYSPRTYCPISFTNGDSKLASKLEVTYWKGLISFSILPKKQRNAGEEFDSYDKDASISIYLNAGKSRILSNEINMMRKTGSVDSVAVCNGKGNTEIVFTDGKQLGLSNAAIIIRNVDENGNEINSLGYEFSKSKTQYFSIRNVNFQSTDMDMYYHDDIEIDMFLSILEEYAKSASYAIAASVHDGCFYTLNNIQSDIGLLLDHNGINNGRRKGSKPGTNSQSSFFNRNAASNAATPSSSSRSSNVRNTSLEEFENGLDD